MFFSRFKILRHLTSRRGDFVEQHYLTTCKHAFAFVPFRGIVEENPNTTEHGRPSVMLEKYASATKMQPQSSGSLRSNAGIEKGKEIAARLNVHRIHSQLRGLDSTGR